MSERRVSVYLVVLGLVAVLLVLTAYLGKAYSGHGVNKDAWVKQNELVLASLPVYPGVVEESAPYSVGNPDPNAKTPFENSGPYESYSTHHTYGLPAAASTNTVLGFYAQQLVGWDQVTLQGAGCEVAYRRKRTSLSVRACSGTLELIVNYQSYNG